MVALPLVYMTPGSNADRSTSIIGVHFDRLCEDSYMDMFLAEQGNMCIGYRGGEGVEGQSFTPTET